MSLTTPGSSNITIEELIDQFSSGSSRKRKGLITTLEKRVEELSNLGPKALSSFDSNGDDWGAGWILQLVQEHFPQSLSSLSSSSSNSWFNTPSSVGINYDPLQIYLLEQSFEEADRFTSTTLRKLAGDGAENRGYVYFSEVKSIPDLDLITIDRLWKAFSQGKFGFSRQANLLKSLNGSYEMLWPRIGWKKDGVWTRYPGSFDWSIDAPEGHMPLINQLRGVRLIDALFNHPALASRT